MPWEKGFFNTTKKFIQKNQPVSYTGALIHPYYWLMSKTEDYICYRTNCNPNSKSKTHVYVVPGTADFPLSLFKLVRRLIRKKNLNDIVSFTIVSFQNRFHGRGIDEFADELFEKIRADKAECIAIIGHSRGGLVGSKAALKAKKHGIKVKAVITLATPFNGSYLALPPLTWFSTSVKQMEIKSKYLEELSALIVQSEISHHFMIAGNDGIVSSGAFIKEYVDKHPNSMKIFPRQGHLSLPTSHELINDICDILKDDTIEEVNSFDLDISSYENFFYLGDDNDSENSIETASNKEASKKSLEINLDNATPVIVDDSFYEDLIYLNNDDNFKEELETLGIEEQRSCRY
ncbi:putative lipase [Legionella busanensis]|uniref:Putative lipase n=1 Tax=Legionella busanensis TaxID=190655 RepID=A0A378JKG5_9GAMM|nr:alpha/beta hydrolase [Legionella busanensis]STX51178.1 putative lipase [Legionella busanensis]